MSRALRLTCCLVLLSAAGLVRGANEPLFSGPQVGEKLAGFKVMGIYDDQAGKEVDFVEAAGAKPLLLVFMHDLTRPSASLTRALAAYAKTRAKDGLQCGVVWLAADRSQAEDYLKRARQSLGLAVPVGISVDGAEGPGSLGLNRKVALTVLVAKDNQVTANFAMVQPAMTDGPKIVAEVVKLIGGKPLTQEEFSALAGGGRPAAATSPNADRLREKLRPVIKLDATEDEVKQAAAAVDELVAKDLGLQRELGSIASRVVNGGNLKNYGTVPAQEQIRRWAEKYGPKE